MNQSRIIMNFTTPPTQDDLVELAHAVLETLPDQIYDFCDDVKIDIEEMADEAIEQELGLDDPFELLALYRSGQEISPGVMSKVANDDDIIILYRRPILDMWCETGEHISVMMRDIIVHELGVHFDFSEEEIVKMSKEHYQGML